MLYRRGHSVGCHTDNAKVEQLVIAPGLTATRPCCTDRRARGLSPCPARCHAMRTDFGRPSSSMRFKARTAIATSVA